MTRYTNSSWKVRSTMQHRTIRTEESSIELNLFGAMRSLAYKFVKSSIRKSFKRPGSIFSRLLVSPHHSKEFWRYAECEQSFVYHSNQSISTELPHLWELWLLHTITLMPFWQKKNWFLAPRFLISLIWRTSTRTVELEITFSLKLVGLKCLYGRWTSGRIWDLFGSPFRATMVGGRVSVSKQTLEMQIWGRLDTNRILRLSFKIPCSV